MYSKQLHDKLFSKLINLSDWSAIIKYIDTYGYWFVLHHFKNDYNILEKYDKKCNRIKINIDRLTVRYNSCINNHHHCPRDGVLNWEKSTSKPTSYPGWEGVIKFTVPITDVTNFSDVINMFAKFGIYFGNGGTQSINGVKYHCHDVKFFESDWPGLTSLRVLDSLGSIENISSWKQFSFGNGSF